MKAESIETMRIKQVLTRERYNMVEVILLYDARENKNEGVWMSRTSIMV